MSFPLVGNLSEKPEGLRTSRNDRKYKDAALLINSTVIILFVFADVSFYQDVFPHPFDSNIL